MAYLIYGPDIDTVSQKVLVDVSNMSSKWPETRALILVPENRKLMTESRYLDLNRQSGLMMAEVLSFSRLSFRLFDLAGISPEDRLTREGQAMLLASLIEAHQDELKLLPRLAKRSGYVEEILTVLNYFRRYLIDPELLMEAAKNNLDPQFQMKFHDFSLLLRYYSQALKDLGRSDAEKDLGDLVELLESFADGNLPQHVQQRLQELRQTWVWVSGFGESREFTPQEYRILKALDRICHQLNVSVITNSIIKKAGEEALVDPAYTIGSLTAMRLLNLLDIEGQVYVDEESKAHAPLTIRAARQIQDEVNTIAGEIKKNALLGGYRYKDIAVCLVDYQSYLPYVRTSFPAYEIPAFIDQRRSLANTPLLRFILALLDAVQSNWHVDHVLALLRSGVCPIDMQTVDALENEWLRQGMRYTGIFHVERYPEDLAEVIQSTLLPLRKTADTLRKLKNCNELIEQFKEVLRLPELGLVAWLEAEIERLSVGPMEDHAVSLAKAWNSLGQILADLSLLFGTKPFDLESLRRILQVAAESNFSGVIPTHLDQVNVGTPEQLLGQSYKIVYILGAKSGQFPAAAIDKSLLKDSDCDYLEGFEGVQIPGLNRYKAESDSFVIQQLFKTAKESLNISYTGHSSDLASSVAILKEEQAVDTILIPREIEQASDPRLMSEDELVRQLIMKMRHDDEIVDPYWQRLAEMEGSEPNRLQGSVRKKEELLGLATVNPKLVQDVLRSMPNLSVSALETYAKCPYEYFSTYLLRAKERDVYEPTPMNRGSLLHAAFERAFNELSMDLVKATTKEAKALVFEEYLNKDMQMESKRLYDLGLAKHIDFAVFEESGQRYLAGRPVRKVIEKAWPALLRQLKEEDYTPYRFEYSFGHHQPIARLQYRTEDGLVLSLRGTIDRIDIRRLADGKIGFRVVDYKSSEHKIEYDDLYEGLDLQILTYLEAVLASGLEGLDRQVLLAEDAMYLKLDEGHITVDQAPEEYELALDRALRSYYKPQSIGRTPEELLLLVEMNHDNWTGFTKQILNGEFDLEPKVTKGATIPCEFCSHRSACKMEKPGQHVTRLPGRMSLAEGLNSRAQTEKLFEILRKRYGRDES